MIREIDDQEYYLIKKIDVENHLSPLGFKTPFLQMLGIIYLKKKANNEDI